MTASNLLAIIPFYRRRDQLDRCLAALAASTYPVQPWIHDNNIENVGFTRAINLGLRQALARGGDTYALLINQDCYVEPETVATLVRFMSNHPRCAIVGPMQLDPDDPDQIVSAGGMQALPQGRVRHGRRSRGDCAQSIPVVWVHGACMFARLAAVTEIGLLDEAMELFCSDADWSLTARARGWETWHCAEAWVFHARGVTAAGAAISAETRQRLDRDNDHYRRKWLGSILHYQLDRIPGQSRLTEPAGGALQKAAQEAQAGRWIQAEMICRDVLDLDSTNLGALNLLARMMWLHYQNATAACDYVERAVAESPNDPELRLLYAIVLDAQRRTEQAIGEYLETARLEDANPQRLEEIAARLQALGRPTEAATVREKLAAMRAK